jgi:HK97 gp10 family phage protein
MSVRSLAEAALHFKHLAHDWPKAEQAALSVAAQIVAAKAKSYIGTYHARPKWPQLTEATQEQRSKQGYAPNEPLLRTGALRDSIEWKVVSNHEAHVGSNNQIAVFQELGTSKIPPRPFLGPAAHNNGPLIERAVKQVIRDYMMQSRMDFDFVSAAIHALREIGHALKEAGESFVSPEDENSRRRR